MRRNRLRLHGKLTVSYMLLTALIALMIEPFGLLYFTFAFYASFSSTEQGIEFADNTLAYVPALAHLIDTAKPDVATLTATMDAVRNAQIHSQEIQTSLSLAVADQSGRVIAISPAGTFLVGKPLLQQILPKERGILERALWGEQDRKKMSANLGFGVGSVAVPIRTLDGRVVGTLFARIHARVHFGLELVPILQATIPWALAIAFLGATCGIVFGNLIARGLTRRLNRITEAADAWSGGDFTPLAPEMPDDELGQLGKRLNRMAQELAQFVLVRQQLAATDERNRLARDLHDTIKQQAFAATLQLATARAQLPSEAPGRENLEIAAGVIEHMQRDLMSLLRELREEKPVDFTEGLRTQATDLARQTEIRVELDLQTFPILPAASASALLAIAQEAFSNIARHSGAHCVWVRVALVSEGRIELAIEDDGSGFDLRNTDARNQSGMGLGNMHIRAEALPGGTFRLSTSPGKGTRIQIACQLPGEKTENDGTIS